MKAIVTLGSLLLTSYAVTRKNCKLLHIMAAPVNTLVLTLLLTACRAAPNTLPSRLALPDTVFTTVGPIPVILVDTLTTKDSTAYVLGRFAYLRRTIYIRREITDPIQRLKTLFHEVCHVEMIESGIHNHIPGDVAELLCDAFASNRVAALIRGRP